MGKRLEKERASLAASQAETAALRASQEKERARAQESLVKLEAQLERERQVKTLCTLCRDGQKCARVCVCEFR